MVKALATNHLGQLGYTSCSRKSCHKYINGSAKEMSHPIDRKFPPINSLGKSVWLR